MQRSFGKIRGLQQCSSSNGTFTCLALDHRQNLRKLLNPDDPVFVTDLDLTNFKLKLLSTLGSASTAVLLDPQYTAAQAVAAGAIPRGTGVVIALEATGYSGDPNARGSDILPGWSVEKARRVGADMVKLLVYYHPQASTAGKIREFVIDVAEQCQQHDLALMLEPLSYSLHQGHAPLSADEKRQVVVSTVNDLSPLNIDLIKIEFPGGSTQENEKEWSSACQEVFEASRVPWILLSAGIDFDTYLRQAMIACQAGASGVAVGRAVWKEAVGRDDKTMVKFLKSEARTRLEKILQACQNNAHSWQNYFSPPPAAADWYLKY